MKTLNVLQSLLLAYALLVGAVYAQEMGSVPLSDQRMPSDDLVYQDRILRTDEAYQLSRQGVDLSTLNPAESAVWSPARRNFNTDDAISLQDDASVEFAGSLLSANGMFRFNIQDGDTTAIVHLDKTLHTLLLRKNILSLLGYKLPPIKWLKRLKVTFGSKEEMQAVLDSQIPRATLGAASRWVVSKDENDLSVVLQDVAITVPDSSDHYNLAMGVPPQTLTSRTLRALLLPYALVDLGESANKFEWTVGRVSNNEVLLPHFTRGNFATTLADAQWMLRRLKALTKEDIRLAVEGAKFPAEVSALVVEKVSARRNSLLKIFSMHESDLPTTVKISSGTYLKEGKLDREEWPGYASRFAHGDPESPFKDVHLYVFAKLQAFVIDNLVTRANSELSVFNPNEVRLDFFKDQFKRGLDHFVETGEFLTFPVGTWFSPVADFGLTLSRDVVVGNYLGTDNLVQLADSIGWTMDLGGHVGVENIHFAPTVAIRGTVNLSKTWSHLKPLRSLNEVFKEPYKNVVVPLMKWQLTKELNRLHELRDSTDTETDWDIKDDESPLSRIITHINRNLGVGESLLYVERLSPLVGGSAHTPSLMGMPVGVKLMASADVLQVRRVQIYRKDAKTIQIYDDIGHGRGWSIDVTLENLIPIVRLGWRRQKGDYSVRLHEVNINPEVSENPRLFDSAHALGEFLQTGSAELLESIQKPHKVDAEYMDRSMRFAFLFWRHKKLKTQTYFDVTSRDGLNGRYVSFTDERQSGLNWEAFVKDIINYGFQQVSGDVSWAVPVFQNPAQTVAGMGETTSVRFEARVTSPNAFDERFMRLTDRWEGWSASVNKLKQRLRKANTKFGFTLFDENTLNNTSGLKLFDVSVNLNLYEEGIKKLAQINTDALIRLENAYEVRLNLHRRGCEEDRIKRRRMSSGQVVESCGTHNAIFNTQRSCQEKVRENKPLEEITKCHMTLFRNLYEELDFNDVKRLLGQENIFVHGSIDGFRNNDEVLNDTIMSNTNGRIGGRFWNGPFDKIQQMLGIQSGEFNGYWLRERL
jgi:hypothetical protein